MLFTKTRSLLLILALLLCSAVASAGISFTAVQAGSIPATPGSEGQIKVSLVTDETIPLLATQFTIKLPDGLSFKAKSEGSSDISLSVGSSFPAMSAAGNVNKGKIVMFNGLVPVDLAPGTYELVTIDVVVDNNYSGTHTVNFTDCLAGLSSSPSGSDRRLDSFDINFRGKVQVSGITISGLPAAVRPSTSPFKLTATVTPSDADYKDIVWKSDNEAVATVSADGTVTPKAEGSALITAQANQPDASKGKASVTVEVLEEIPTSITISGASATGLKDGQTCQLTATVLPAGVKDRRVTWSSSNPAIVSVNADGLVTAHAKLGTATITATSNAAPSVKATVSLSVIATPVASVTVTGAKNELKAGETVSLAASVLPANATDKSVTWASDNTGAATVDASGVVTAVAAGSATITATAADGSGAKGSFAITVKPTPVSSITLAPSAKELYVGATVTLVVSVSPANATNKTLTWASDRPAVASVENGVVKAVGLGSAVITAAASDGSGIEATATVNVVPTPVTGFSITAPASIQVGATGQITATIEPSDATATSADIKWTSSNTAIATVDANGIVTAGQTPGTVTITAVLTDRNGKTFTATADINIVGIAVTAISIATPSKTQFKDGETIQLTATVSPGNATDKIVTWSSSDADIATVSDNGTVTAHAKLGKVTITATAKGGTNIAATVDLTVIATPVSSVTVTGAKNELKSGETVSLTASVLPANATDKSVTWASDNTNVATVDASGVVTAVAAGTATITATAADGSGAKGSFALTVKPTPWSAETAFNPAQWEMIVGENLTATLDITPATATCKDFDIVVNPANCLTWTKGADGKITFTAAADGSATVTANPTEGEGSATMTVKINASPAILDAQGNAVTAINLPMNSEVDLTTNTMNVSNWAIIEGDAAQIVRTEGNKVVLRGIRSNGAVKLRATFSNSLTAIVAVTVTEPIFVPAKSVVLTPVDAFLLPGDYFTPAVTILPTDHSGATLTWSSSNENVASVSADGKVHAVGLGHATITITVTNADGSVVTDWCRVFVSIPSGIDGVTDSDNMTVTVIGNEIVVFGLPELAHVRVYNLAGRLVADRKGACRVQVSAGMYIVKVQNRSVKVTVR